MDIILLQKVANLGTIGDRVKVKSGYARNYLVPTGRATMATACSNASSVPAVGRVTPLTLRTYWRAAASISSAVATGSRPLRVVILRHMPPRLGR